MNDLIPPQAEVYRGVSFYAGRRRYGRVDSDGNLRTCVTIEGIRADIDRMHLTLTESGKRVPTEPNPLKYTPPPSERGKYVFEATVTSRRKPRRKAKHNEAKP